MAKKLNKSANLLGGILSGTPTQTSTPTPSQEPIAQTEPQPKKDGRGRPTKSPEERTWGKGKTYDRVTHMMNMNYYEKIKEIARREGLTPKDVLEEAMRVAIETYERNNGEVIPQERSAKGIF